MIEDTIIDDEGHVHQDGKQHADSMEQEGSDSSEEDLEEEEDDDEEDDEEPENTKLTLCICPTPTALNAPPFLVEIIVVFQRDCIIAIVVPRPTPIVPPTSQPTSFHGSSLRARNPKPRSSSLLTSRRKPSTTQTTGR
jgi:hypothetical protein